MDVTRLVLAVLIGLTISPVAAHAVPLEAPDPPGRAVAPEPVPALSPSSTESAQLPQVGQTSESPLTLGVCLPGTDPRWVNAIGAVRSDRFIAFAA